MVAACRGMLSRRDTCQTRRPEIAETIMTPNTRINLGRSPAVEFLDISSTTARVIPSPPRAMIAVASERPTTASANGRPDSLAADGTSTDCTAPERLAPQRLQ